MEDLISQALFLINGTILTSIAAFLCLMAFWAVFKWQDFKERFLNFETAKGMYLIPAGASIIYLAIFYEQFVYKATFVIFGWYFVSEGMRKFFVNRIKQQFKQSVLIEKREVTANVQ